MTDETEQGVENSEGSTQEEENEGVNMNEEYTKRKTPTFTVNESAEPMPQRNTGGRDIVIYGDSGKTKDLTTVHSFNNYDEALIALGPEDEDNKLLNSIKEALTEGSTSSVDSNMGMGLIYAINVGSNPTLEDYKTAIESTKRFKSIRHELYLDFYVSTETKELLEDISSIIEELEDRGLYRIAGFTIDNSAEDLKTADEIKLLNSDVKNSRVYIHVDPKIQSKFIAKTASCPFFISPAYGTYNSVTSEEILPYNDDDREILAQNGFISDMEGITDSNKAEPCMDWSTSSSLNEADSRLHARILADEHASAVDKIIQRYIKANNEENNLILIEEYSKSYLDTQVEDKKLKGYGFELTQDPQDSDGIIVKLSLNVLGAIINVTINRRIEY